MRHLKPAIMMLSLSMVAMAQDITPSEPKDLGQVVDWGDGEDHIIAPSWNWKGGDGQIEHNLTLINLGIERFKSGKREENIWEQWEIRLYDPPIPGSDASKRGDKYYCQLERTIITNVYHSLGLVQVSTYSTIDGDLKVNRVDWKNGIFDFRIDQGASEMHCEIQFKVNGEYAYLESIRGTDVYRIKTNDVPTEYKLTEYSYVLNVPILMEGRKTAGERKWNKLIASLSHDDQEAWRELRKGKRKLIGPGKKWTKDAIYDFFANSKISSQGIKNLTDFLIQNM